MATGRYRRTDRSALAVVAAVFALLIPAFAGGARAEANPAADPNPFERPGMWIWYVDDSQGGSIKRIIQRAKASNIGTLYIKSADGTDTDTWRRQFTRKRVSRLQNAGLKVCGWHYVYGSNPIGEAKASAFAKRQGADCFVIDAETEYEGRYAAADRYIRKLRRLVGPRFPLGLSTFPYVHYHQSFPYSVFLGPGAATWNLPQVYWYTIGDSVRESVGLTWYHNRIYGRPIRPIGQTYENPPLRELIQFRQLMLAYKAVPSWWSWQETNRSEWKRLGRQVKGPPRRYRRVTSFPTLKRGSKGDQTVWMQQHLRGARFKPPLNGVFNKRTERAVKNFQRSRNLAADGVVGNQTWKELLKVEPVSVSWSKAGSGRRGMRFGIPSASAPLSASIPPVRNELAGKPGR